MAFTGSFFVRLYITGIYFYLTIITALERVTDYSNFVGLQLGQFTAAWGLLVSRYNSVAVEKTLLHDFISSERLSQ